MRAVTNMPHGFQGPWSRAQPFTFTPESDCSIGACRWLYDTEWSLTARESGPWLTLRFSAMPVLY